MSGREELSLTSYWRHIPRASDCNEPVHGYYVRSSSKVGHRLPVGLQRFASILAKTSLPIECVYARVSFKNGRMYVHETMLNANCLGLESV